MFKGCVVTVGRRYLLGSSGYVIKLGGHAGCHGNRRLTDPLKTPNMVIYDEIGVFPTVTLNVKVLPKKGHNKL